MGLAKNGFKPVNHVKMLVNFRQLLQKIHYLLYE